MSPRRFGARSARAMATDVRSSESKVDVLRLPDSNSITASRSPSAGRRPSTISSCAVQAHNAYEAERWFGPLFVRETGGAWPPGTWVE